jgi:hypothetical protein
MHDAGNMPFDTLKRLYDLANTVTCDRIVAMKMEMIH